MAITISDKDIQRYRRITYRINPELRLTSVEDAREHVDARGFVMLWPIKGIEMPSLWTAVAGDKPVANEHDDPGHITWSWKDQMLDQRRWYYGKLLRGKATFVSLGVLPFYYALAPRLADLDDYHEAYHAGHLTHEAKAIADILLKRGPQNSVGLRQLTHMTAQSSKSRFNRALTDLQRGLWILPIGIAEAGSWRYAFIYELFDRWFPGVPEQARGISLRQARAELARYYLRSLGVSESREITKLFRWETKTTLQALEDLETEGDAQLLSGNRWAISAIVQGKTGA
jgi:uncharacterized protein YcaQ